MLRDRAPASVPDMVRVPERGERVLVVCPHPDDETLTTGGLLAEAARRGAEITVVYLTSGDGFPLAAAREFRRRPDQRAMRALAPIREGEALAALRCLGVDSGQVRFLRHPDRGLAPLWLERWSAARPYPSRYTGRDRVVGSDQPYCGSALLSDLDRLLSELRPDLVFGPDPADDHPDHWAGACFLAAAIERHLRRGGSPACFSCLVHRGNWPAPMRPDARSTLTPPKALRPLDVDWYSLPLGEAALAAKRAALQAHRTQLPLVGRFLRSFLRGSELFSQWPSAAWRSGEALLLRDPIRDRFGRAWCPGVDITALELERGAGHARLDLRLRGTPQAWASYVLSWSAVPDDSSELVPHRVSFDGAETRARKSCGVELDSRVLATGALLVGAEVWCGSLLLDRTPWRVVRAI